MQIRILAREDVSNIDAEQWDKLASDSVFVNPFYERWSLIPALEFLHKEDEVYVVATYDKDVLTALFPIHLKLSYFGIRYLCLWRHTHCFLCDPLIQSTVSLAKIFNYVLRKMKVSVMRIPQHSELSYGEDIDRRSVVFSSTRGAIFNTSDIKRHLGNLPSRVRAENKRITKRLFKEVNAQYITSKDEPNRNWLDDYCQLEHAGWKRNVSGSILSDDSQYNYYRAMYNLSKISNNIEFRGIFDEQSMLSISFRITSRNHAFELKTSYNEKFKRLYPGVVLELMNLDDLSSSKFKFVDSSTNSDNSLINKLWPEQRKLVNSLYFDGRLMGKLLKFMYKIKNRMYF